MSDATQYVQYRSDGEDESYVQIYLSHVRAADDIRIRYDFDRDGWVVEQASVFEWDTTGIVDPVCDPEWAEVAFILAWGRAKKKDDDTPAKDGE